MPAQIKVWFESPLDGREGHGCLEATAKTGRIAIGREVPKTSRLVKARSRQRERERARERAYVWALGPLGLVGDGRMVSAGSSVDLFRCVCVCSEACPDLLGLELGTGGHS